VKADGGQAGAGACRAATCAELGVNCGTAPDRCGGVVSCGNCQKGTLCGGDGPNKCGSHACAFRSCSQVGASCGYSSDGCSKALDCGTCSDPYVCVLAATNQCVLIGSGGSAGAAGSCTPNWDCSGYSTCDCNADQTRSCTDKSGCEAQKIEHNACSHCGNGLCDCSETFSNCPADCPCTSNWTCTPATTCNCQNTQTLQCTDSNHCASDYTKSGSCNHRGNASCDCGETHSSCPQDGCAYVPNCICQFYGACNCSNQQIPTQCWDQNG